MRKIIFALIVLTCGVSAHASTTANGQVSNLIALSNGVIFFSQGTGRSSPPACGTQGDRWVIDTKTEGGAAQYALLLTAWAQGKQVQIVGNGTCGVWGDTEGVDHIIINS